MNIAIIAIGIPGSGKTTVLKSLAERHGLVYLNRDDLREEILGDARDRSQNKVIWEEANRRAAEALAAGKGVVLDSTFIETKKRIDIIDFLREHGAGPVIGVIADVSLEVAKERNATRDRMVPDKVLHSIQEKFTSEPPTLEEGFDALLTLDELARLEASLG